ncbi:FecCD family ABC transporter permease [Thiomicrospira sp. S5]|uniref:FecCD family ABC transporter permease n=1 Tax=Thiomicrospira sp. S5 TaxID=1803865 RepID=UPI000F8A0629|nr:iron ABC transporter permease [Thiomicrospira sp. S5]AZR82994.1 iron ABC transporter [Thiomicrospira sp. S5]
MRLTHSPLLALSILALITLLVSLYSLSVGAISIDTAQVLSALFGADVAMQTDLVVNEIRLPRLLLGILVGAGLAVSGAAMQGLFRNPLADPGLVGVSSGAALAAVTVIVLGSSFLSQWVVFWGFFALPFAAFLGGLFVTWLIYRVATKNGRTDVGLMLLTGIAINAIAGSATGILTYFATDEELRTLTFWTMGSIASASWQDLAVATVPILVAVLLLPYFARPLNAFLMGEAVTSHMGFNVKQLKWGVIALTALSVGAAVSVSGVIGFVGLVAPHIVRLILGPDHRWVLPGSALVGAILVVASDMFARTVLSPAELPIGIVMSAIGGPFFLWLLIQRRSRVGF